MSVDEFDQHLRVALEDDTIAARIANRVLRTEIATSFTRDRSCPDVTTLSAHALRKPVQTGPTELRTF
jgi:hypothetical protein